MDNLSGHVNKSKGKLNHQITAPVHKPKKAGSIAGHLKKNREKKEISIAKKILKIAKNTLGQ